MSGNNRHLELGIGGALQSKHNSVGTFLLSGLLFLSKVPITAPQPMLQFFWHVTGSSELHPLGFPLRRSLSVLVLTSNKYYPPK